jgi:hypothetical protein
VGSGTNVGQAAMTALGNNNNSLNNAQILAQQQRKKPTPASNTSNGAESRPLK